MRTDLIINGVVILIVAWLAQMIKGLVGGILDLVLWIIIIVLVIVGILRIVEGVIARPGRRVY